MKKIITQILLILLSSDLYPQSGWNQQTLPVSGTISDMQFINSQTGWITLFNPTNLIKTTNGGNNWIVTQTGSDQFEHFEFINDTLGYATGRTGANGQISKTTNGGINWSLLYTGSNYYSDLSFLNNDTGYFCGTDGNFGGIWRTTNGGASIARIFTKNFFTIEQIFFLQQNYNNEYYGWWLSSGFMSQTTNSGFNWSAPTRMINGQNGDFISLDFMNKDTGWVVFRSGSDYRIYKTKDNGIFWELQFRDSNGILDPTYLDVYDYQRIWSGNGFSRIVHATSNSGEVWGTQATPITRPVYIDIIDSLNGSVGYFNLAHTTDGGGLITYIGADPLNSEIPKSFTLKQNYPNPFNPQTTIEFSIKKSSNVSLILFDILGKEILKIYNNENLNTGNYKAVLDFSKDNLSSGTYFYKLMVSDNNSRQIFLETKMLTYIK